MSEKVTIEQITKLARDVFGPATKAQAIDGVRVFNDFGGEFVQIKTGPRLGLELAKRMAYQALCAAKAPSPWPGRES